VAALLLLAGPAAAGGVILVDSLEDLPDFDLDDGVCDADPDTPGQQVTLRAAVQHANATPGADEIVLPEGTFKLSLQGEGENLAATGDLDVEDELLVTGVAPPVAGAKGGTVLDAAKLKDRLFDVRLGASLHLHGLTLRKARSPEGESGGALRVAGRLELEQVVIRNCHTPGDGGAIQTQLGAEGAWLTQVLLLRNSADGQGGALAIQAGVLDAEACTLQANSAKGEGGGLLGGGALALLSNCTFSGNSAKLDGGAVRLGDGSVLTLLSSTLARNACKQTAGIAALPEGDLPGTALLRNVVLDNKGERNGAGLIVSLGGNLDSGTTCNFPSADQSGVNPRLLKLDDWGGFTPTHSLHAESPAIDRGHDAGCPVIDQRGLPRLDVAGLGLAQVVCDAGAFEYAAEAQP
jgi:predicted outer membrane repeat protein